MKFLRVLSVAALGFLAVAAVTVPAARAADSAPAPAETGAPAAPPPAAATPETAAPKPSPTLPTEAAAAVSSGLADPEAPDFLEHLVDAVLALFDVRSSGNTATHYGIAAFFLVAGFLLRRVVTTFLFGFFRRLAARTQTTLDDKLFPALEAPVAYLIFILSAVAALKVLKLTVSTDSVIRYASTLALSFGVFWLLLRAFNTLLDHAHEIAREKQSGIAAFMPWIKKTLLAVFIVFGALLIAQSLGADVKAFLAGLGLGGLAFALAAQDTLANLFGSVVVAIDQPFKIGETVRIGGATGTVEDIGLRSTKIRLVDRSLAIIPNKSVAGENITNLSRFTGRRVEQVLGLTYAAKSPQVAGLVDELRRLILAQPEVDPTSVHVYFRDFSASSLDVWLVYVVNDPDFAKHMALRQRLNLAFMAEVEARGLAFAFPTQTVQLESAALDRIAAAKAPARD